MKGENLMIFVEEDDLLGNGSTAKIALAAATSCSLNMNTEAFDMTSKDSGSWAASTPGMRSWDASTDNLVTPHIDALMALWINRTPVTIYWSPAVNTELNNEVTHAMGLTVDGETYKYYTGTVWINNVSVNAPNNEAANYTVSFTGTGPLTPSNVLPGSGISVNQTSLAKSTGSSTQVQVSNYTGTLTATTSSANITATVGNYGVITIAVNAETEEGIYTVAITDSGTSTKAYVTVTVS